MCVITETLYLFYLSNILVISKRRLRKTKATNSRCLDVIIFHLIFMAEFISIFKTII